MKMRNEKTDNDEDSEWELRMKMGNGHGDFAFAVVSFGRCDFGYTFDLKKKIHKQVRIPTSIRTYVCEYYIFSSIG